MIVAEGVPSATKAMSAREAAVGSPWFADCSCTSCSTETVEGLPPGPVSCCSAMWFGGALKRQYLTAHMVGFLLSLHPPTC